MRTSGWNVAVPAAVLILFLLPAPGPCAGAAPAGHAPPKGAAHGRDAAERRIPLALPDFVVEGDADPALAKDLPGIVAADLSMTPPFEIVSPDAYLEPMTPDHFRPGGRTPDFPSWKMTGAEGVAIGRVEGRGDRVTVEVRLHGTGGALLLERRYAAPKRLARNVAHRFANEIQFAFTGFRGIFDTEIAFTAHPGPGGTGRGKEIFLVGLEGGEARQVTDNRSFNLFPRWSPDGRRIAFTSFRTGIPRIHLRDTETGKERTLAPSGNSLTPGCFSPAGDILYYSASESGSTDIHALPLDGDNAVRVVTGAISTSPSVSPDGRRMAFVSDRTGAPAVYVREPGQLSDRRVSPAGKFSTSPSWSPAGDLIAFTSQVNGRFSLHLVKPDGTDLRTLASGNGNCIDPSFSPDGRHVAYTFQEKERSEIRIVSVDGRLERTLVAGMPGAGSPSWSPRRP